MNPNFSKSYTADVDIAPYLILQTGSVDGNATLATAATQKFVGVSENVPVAAGQVVDAIKGGPGLVTAGGTISAGDFLTSNASSQAITAVPGTGLTVNVFGTADVSAVAGDVFPFTTAVSQLHG